MSGREGGVEDVQVRPGDRVEVVIRGTVTAGGDLMLDDNSIWRLLPKAASIRIVPRPG